MSPILFFVIFFICTGVGKIFLQINSAAVAFIDILIAAWEGLIAAWEGLTTYVMMMVMMMINWCWWIDTDDDNRPKVDSICRIL